MVYFINSYDSRVERVAYDGSNHAVLADRNDPADPIEDPRALEIDVYSRLFTK